MRYISLLYTILVIATMVALIVRGFRRRIPHWTAQSWRRFLGVMSIGAALVAVVFVESWIADRWFAEILASSRDATSLWALSVLAVMCAGCGVVSWVIFWFAQADPARPFPGIRNWHELLVLVPLGPRR